MYIYIHWIYNNNYNNYNKNIYIEYTIIINILFNLIYFFFNFAISIFNTFFLGIVLIFLIYNINVCLTLIKLRKIIERNY